ncbi:MAG: hypothetical protein ACIAXF_02230 [Phycisphaerales bacterium JB063]
MAHGPTHIDEADKTPMGAKAWPAWRTCIILAIVGLVLLATAMIPADVTLVGGGMSRLMFAYLVGYCFFLALTVGSVAIVILTHLFRAGWVVAVRRVPETFAANFLWVGILALPIIITALVDSKGSIYPWAMSMDELDKRIHHADEVLHHGGGHHDEDAHHDDEGHADTDADVTILPVAETEHGHDDPQAGHAAADGTHALTGQPLGSAYPEDRDEALAIQEAEYTTLLAYMLDYKRFNGEVAHHNDKYALVPPGKGMKIPGLGLSWYNPGFYVFRIILYMAAFSLIGLYYWRQSVAQDASADPAHTTKREWWAPASVIVFALATTFVAFDVLMSLDPAWYSTMFGVIFFANSLLAGICFTILVCLALQKKGLLKAVRTDHYHDLGKLLFAFTFFWGYVSFSQFMLIWYASLPETTYWFEIRGATTVLSAPQFGSGWSWIILVLLFGHLIVPFGFLLSRHVKRNLTLLAGAAIWMLLMIYLDLFWYIMPAYDSSVVTFGLPEIGAVLAVGGVVFAQFFGRFRQHAPVPHNDPRLNESLALDTSAWAPIHH